MKKYDDCMRTDEMCGLCSLSNRGRDCHNKIINKVTYLRSLAGMTQKEVSESSGVNIRQIQKYESGEYNTGNMTLKNAIALAKALDCEVHDFV